MFFFLLKYKPDIQTDMICFDCKTNLVDIYVWLVVTELNCLHCVWIVIRSQREPDHIHMWSGKNNNKIIQNYEQKTLAHLHLFENCENLQMYFSLSDFEESDVTQ